MSRFSVLSVTALVGALGIGATLGAEPSGRYPALPLDDLSPVGQLHGDPIDADLRLFMAGNQFVLMDQLVAGFQARHPEYDDIFYVTLPPGLELQWILAGGVEFHAPHSLAATGLQLTVMPDVFTTINLGHLKQLKAAGLAESYTTYAHNRLALLASANDPLAGKALGTEDFVALMADPEVKISEPDIATQGIERHIWQMYMEASRKVFPEDGALTTADMGMFDPEKLAADPHSSLRRQVYHDKVASGATRISRLAHHLETPAWIRDGSVRLGPVWITEAIYAITREGATDLVAIEIDGKDAAGGWLDRRDKVNYMATALTREGTNTEAAADWIAFLNSPEGAAIYAEAGFIPATEAEQGARPIP